MTQPGPDPAELAPAGRARGPVMQFLAENGWATAAAAIATLIVELAVPLAGAWWRHGGLGFLSHDGLTSHEALAGVAACVLWTVLAAPALAAPGRTAMGAIFRGGVVADTGLISLLVLWGLCPQVTFPAALKVYCVLAAVALAGIAATRLARTPAGRYACAAAATAVLLALLASPFWVGGAIHDRPRPVAEWLVEAAVRTNPFYAATAALTETTRFVWHQATVMYRITRIGDYAAAPPLAWLPTVIVYLVAAAVLGAGAKAAAVVRGR